MDLKKAAANTLILLSKNVPDLPESERNEEGDGLAHQMWVLDQVTSGEVSGMKGHRWLGWAQGSLSAGGYLSLTDCKYANVLA